jgi:hypothetical protein
MIRVKNLLMSSVSGKRIGNPDGSAGETGPWPAGQEEENASTAKDRLIGQRIQQDPVRGHHEMSKQLWKVSNKQNTSTGANIMQWRDHHSADTRNAPHIITPAYGEPSNTHPTLISAEKDPTRNIFQKDKQLQDNLEDMLRTFSKPSTRTEGKLGQPTKSGGITRFGNPKTFGNGWNCLQQRQDQQFPAPSNITETPMSWYERGGLWDPPGETAKRYLREREEGETYEDWDFARHARVKALLVSLKPKQTKYTAILNKGAPWTLYKKKEKRISRTHNGFKKRILKNRLVEPATEFWPMREVKREVFKLEQKFAAYGPWCIGGGSSLSSMYSKCSGELEKWLS